MSNKVKLQVLYDEVKIFQSRLQPHDTRHLHTTISVLNNRITELELLVEEDLKKVVAELSLGVCYG
jgi:hypothetical protein